jgi:hypothetical protein
VADHRQQGEGEHHQRNVTVPAMPAARLVVVEPKFGLGGLERILDRPAMALHPHQGLHQRAGRTPRGEERQILIGDGAPDQQTARPQAGGLGAVFLGLKVRQLDRGPVIQARSLGPVSRRQAPPGL